MMGFAEKIEGGNYTHKDVVDMFRWFDLAKANEKMLIMDRENAEKREYEVLGRANTLEQQVKLLRDALRGMLDLDEENHQRGAGDDDICAEVRAAYEALMPNAIGQGSAACGASPAPTGYASGDKNE